MTKITKKLSLLVLGILFSAAIIAGHYSSNTATATNQQTIAQIASGNKKFTTLVAALKAAGLAKVLNQPGEYTVFAPTNAAFEKLPKGTLKTLLEPQNRDKLKAILLYHVVKGKVASSQVQPGDVKTLEGSDIKVTTKGGKLIINNGADIVGTDINASNGVIHVIDAVLIPPQN